MDADKQNAVEQPHSGHRERVRNLFLESGLDGFSDHNILELLLFYTIPKRDTNVIAHDLIDRFGSLRRVLDAKPEELCSVKGMGMYTATFLSILPQLARRYCISESRQKHAIKIEDQEAVETYLRSRFIGESQECIYMLAFGNDGQMTGCTKVTTGSLSKIRFDGRAIVEAAFRMGAVSAVLSHNHPGGVAAPSQDDVDTTKIVANTLSACNIHLVDHIIFAGDECFHMASHINFHTIFFKI